MRRIARVAVVVLLVAPAAFADREVRHDFRVASAAAGIQKVIVEIPISEMKVTTSTAKEIVVSGYVTREYDRLSEMAGAERIAKNSGMEIDIRGSRAIIRRKFAADLPRRAKNSDTEFHLNVTLPDGVDLEIRQRIGELELEGAFGNIDIDMSIGEVTIHVPKKNIKELSARTTIGEVRTNVGDRIISREGIFAGRTHFYNDGGRSTLNVRLTIGEIDIALTDK